MHRPLTWSTIVVCGLGVGVCAASEHDVGSRKLYRVVDGKVDTQTYNGYRRYNGGCNHCHGPDGMGSTFARSLIDKLPDAETFRRAVIDGVTGASTMKGFSGDPNVEPYVDDIYAYLQARADGVLGRGRPERLDE